MNLYYNYIGRNRNKQILAENSGAGQTVYTITADANDGGTIGIYAIGGDDASLLQEHQVELKITLTGTSRL